MTYLSANFVVWFSEVNFKRKYLFGPDSTGDVWNTEGTVFRVKFYFKYIGENFGPKLNFRSSEEYSFQRGWFWGVPPY